MDRDTFKGFIYGLILGIDSTLLIVYIPNKLLLEYYFYGIGVALLTIFILMYNHAVYVAAKNTKSNQNTGGVKNYKNLETKTFKLIFNKVKTPQFFVYILGSWLAGAYLLTLSCIQALENRENRIQEERWKKEDKESGKV